MTDDYVEAFQWLTEHNPKAIILRDFYDAVIGIELKPNGRPVLVYSVDSILQLLTERDNLDHADAMVHLQNIVRDTWHSEHKPLLVNTFSPEQIALWTGALESMEKKETESVG